MEPFSGQTPCTLKSLESQAGPRPALGAVLFAPALLKTESVSQLRFPRTRDGASARDRSPHHKFTGKSVLMIHGRPQGYLSFTLHAHLPYVVHHGVWPHGLEWLLEASAETYLPLLRVLGNLERDGIGLNANVNLS